MSSASLHRSELFSGARAENSVLFSLNALAPARPAAVDASPPRPRSDVRAPLDAASSGLIDLNSILSEPAPMSLARSVTTALPAPSPRITAQTRVASTREPAASRGGLLATIAALGVATVFLGVWAVIQTTPQTPTRVVIQTAPEPASVAAVTPEDRAALASEHDAAATPPVADATGDAADAADAADTADVTEATAASKRAPPRRPRPSKKPPKSAPPPTASETPAAAPAADGPAVDSVECLLHPKRCMPSRAAPTEPSTPKGPVSAALPDKLSLSQIKRGLASAKQRAERECRAHAAAGSKLAIKLSINGSNGQVASATSMTAGASAALVACATAALRTASFEPFSSAQQGTAVTLRF
ncbi:MAG: hypothetical protein H6713_38770 [Myxococcales bacterium]|nr:hypothetical protein [Myxococcales bacterium]